MKTIINSFLSVATFAFFLQMLASCNQTTPSQAPATPVPDEKTAQPYLKVSPLNSINTPPLKKTAIQHKEEIPPVENENVYALKDGLYGEITTKSGPIIIQLFHQKTPLTVANFVGLAEGTKYSNNQGHPFFDKTTFYQVVRNFVIKAGDPTGTGKGTPGYTFPDEFDKTLSHDSPGIVSMDSSGPNSNGCRFFITLKATPWLDNRNVIFGKVVKGQELLPQIKEGDKIESIKILRIGKEFAGYKVTQDFFAKLLKQKYHKDGRKPKPKRLKRGFL